MFHAAIAQRNTSKDEHSERGYIMKIPSVSWWRTTTTTVVLALVALTAGAGETLMRDDFDNQPEQRWRFVSDRVMGGISNGNVIFDRIGGDSMAWCYECGVTAKTIFCTPEPALCGCRGITTELGLIPRPSGEKLDYRLPVFCPLAIALKADCRRHQSAVSVLLPTVANTAQISRWHGWGFTEPYRRLKDYRLRSHARAILNESLSMAAVDSDRGIANDSAQNSYVT